MLINLRKIFIILAFLTAIILISWLLYFFFFRPVAPPPIVVPPEEVPTVEFPPVGPLVTRPPVEEVPGILPIEEIPKEKISEIAEGGYTQVSPIVEKEYLQSPTISFDGQSMLYYNREEGKFYQLFPDGIKKLLSEKTFYQVKDIIWAPDKNKAILEYPDGTKTLYDFSEERQVTLPKEWYNFSFSPQSEEITFLTESSDPRNRWLAISRADGSGVKIIEPLGENADKVQVDWSPNQQIIAMSRTGEALGAFRQEVLMIGQHGENFKSIVVEGRGFKGKWFPRGDRLLYHVWNPDNNYNPSLWMVDAQGESIGQDRKNLGLSTWIDKCAFSTTSDYLFCAVPESLPKGSGLYPEIANNVSDNFYKINLRTGYKSLLAKPVGDYTVDQLVLSDDGQYLYFTDKNKTGVYKIQLK